jgi:alpha-L-fucosidase
MSMTKSLLLHAAAFTIAAMIPAFSTGISAQDNPFPETEKRMEWFSEAKLGIFIHWGIYAVDGVSESWSFYNKYLPYEQYMSQKDRFTASKYQPKDWVRLIKESGARYTVITSKHHDGVALWPTKAGSLSVDRITPSGRDLLSPFV